MKPLVRLYTIVFTATTAIVFFLWGAIQNMISSNLQYAIPLGGLIALGTYRFILSMVLLGAKIKMIKKFLFGKYYLEGVWVGCYIGANQSPIYFIENYEQDFDNLLIRGRSYYDNGSYKGNWISEKVSIDVEKGKISYNYLTNMINNTHLNQGQGEFIFVRSSLEKEPKKLIGFSCDLYSDVKIKSFLIKTTDEDNKDDTWYLKIAQDYYEKNKNFFS